jgi:hypothetical protein
MLSKQNSLTLLVVIRQKVNEIRYQKNKYFCNMLLCKLTLYNKVNFTALNAVFFAQRSIFVVKYRPFRALLL